MWSTAWIERWGALDREVYLYSLGRRGALDRMVGCTG